MTKYEFRLMVTVNEKGDTVPWIKYLLKYEEVIEQSPRSFIYKLLSSTAVIKITKIVRKRS